MKNPSAEANGKQLLKSCEHPHPAQFLAALFLVVSSLYGTETLPKRTTKLAAEQY